MITTFQLLVGQQRDSSHAIRKAARRKATPRSAQPNDAYRDIFRDVTRQADVHFHHQRAASAKKMYVETMGAGVAWIDYDQDGYLDAFFVNSGYTPLFHPPRPPQPALYHNNRDGTFTDVTVKSGIHTDGTFFFGVAVGDYDNDGYPDIYMTGYRHSVLLHNNGDGTFTDVTAAAGVGNDGNWGTAAAWFDYDRDGRLDLLVVNYVQYDVDHPVICGDFRPGFRSIPQVSSYCHPDNFPGTSPRLYHNDGNGKFTDVSAEAGLINKDGKGLAVVAADFNNDGWPDIFIANDTQRNFLYINNGNGTFRDASYTSGAGFSEDGRTEAGMSADAADVTNNGLLDLFVSHLDHELNRFYRNQGNAIFTDDTMASGIRQSDFRNSAFGARFFDFDNDGWRDLLVVNGHILDNIAIYHPDVSYAEQKKLYHNVGGLFADITNSLAADFRAPHVGRGLAVGDYDNDGWQDFLVSNNGEEAQLFHNEGANLPATRNNHWLAVKLLGTRSNRDGIGARLQLTAGNFKSYDQSKGGMSYCSAQDPRIFFGLGARDHIDSLEVWWPSGLKQTFSNVPVDTFLRVEEGEPLPEVISYGKNKITGEKSTVPRH